MCIVTLHVGKVDANICFFSMSWISLMTPYLPIRPFPQRALVLRRENGSCCVMQRVQARAAGLSLFCYHHNLVQVKQRLLEVCCSRMLGRANLFAGELIWANPCPGESVSGRIRSGRIRPGESVPGESVPGESVRANPYPGESVVFRSL